MPTALLYNVRFCSASFKIGIVGSFFGNLPITVCIQLSLICICPPAALGIRCMAFFTICLLSPKTTCPVGVTKTWSKPLLLPYLPPGMTRQPISFAQALTTCSVSFPSLSKPCLILSTVFCCDLGASNEIPFPIGLLPIRPRLVGVRHRYRRRFGHQRKPRRRPVRRHCGFCRPDVGCLGRRAAGCRARNRGGWCRPQ